MELTDGWEQTRGQLADEELIELRAQIGVKALKEILLRIFIFVCVFSFTVGVVRSVVEHWDILTK